MSNLHESIPSFAAKAPAPLRAVPLGTGFTRGVPSRIHTRSIGAKEDTAACRHRRGLVDSDLLTSRSKFNCVIPVRRTSASSR
jgi:hypothetical protein